MKKSVIKDIFYGVRGGMDSSYAPEDKEYRDTLIDLHKELRTQLNAQQLALHEKFVAVLEDCQCDEVDYYFTEGFKLGFHLALECLQD